MLIDEPIKPQEITMTRARIGDRVTVNYIGTLDDGRMFANTNEEGALEFTLGADEVFPALEEEIVGMREGEVKNIVLAAPEAYGLRSEENLLKVARSSFPPDRKLTVGKPLTVDFTDGHSLTMRIHEVTEGYLVLDGNHALAGCDLTFALRLDKIEQTS
jgi:FKBP-type peptidyl-prolyl cis-trans isomerase 2